MKLHQKSFATKNADTIALFLARFVALVCTLFTPVVFFLNIITSFFIKILGGARDSGPTMTEEDLKTIVTVGHEEGVLEEQEKEGKILIIRPQVKVDVGRIEKDKAKLTVLYKQGFHDGGQMIETMKEYLEK